MRVRNKTRWMALCVVTTVGLLAAACSSSSTPPAASSTKTVNIGALYDLTGSFSGLGIADLGGLKTAAADVNKGGGFVVNGTHYKIAITSVDGQSTSAGATAAVTQLVQNDGINIILGPDPSAEAITVQTLITPDHVLFMTLSGTVANNLLAQGANTPANQLVFNLSAPASFWGKYVVDAALKSDPSAKTATVSCTNLASQQPYLTGAVQELAAKGINVPSSQQITYAPTTTDFSSILTGIKAYHPDLYFAMCSTSATIQALATQSVGLGTVYGSGGLYTIGASVNVGTQGNNGGPLPFAYGVVNQGYPLPNGLPTSSFLAKYQQVNGTAPPVTAVENSTSYYAPLMALVAAMEKAGTVSNTSKIAKELVHVTGSGPVGSITFSSNHVAEIPFTSCRVVSGTVTCTKVPGT